MTSNQEPWKDANTLRDLYEDKTQAEMAEHFTEQGHDVTASTVAYWMDKLEVNTSHTQHDDGESEKAQKCCNYDECGNRTFGANNEICMECLDEARHKQREREIAERQTAY